jgi:hypothetical protein
MSFIWLIHIPLEAKTKTEGELCEPLLTTLDRPLTWHQPKEIVIQTGPTFAIFGELPLELQRRVWQDAQPPRILQLVFSDECILMEPPAYIPNAISQVCREARNETLLTFHIIPEGLPFRYLPLQGAAVGHYNVPRGSLKAFQDAKQIRNRIAWLEPARDVIFWNSNFTTRRIWDEFQDREQGERLLGIIDESAISHVMISADFFSGGFWNGKRPSGLSSIASVLSPKRLAPV